VNGHNGHFEKCHELYAYPIPPARIVSVNGHNGHFRAFSSDCQIVRVLTNWRRLHRRQWQGRSGVDEVTPAGLATAAAAWCIPALAPGDAT